MNSEFLIIPTLPIQFGMTATSVLIIAFIAAPPVDIYGIRCFWVLT
jgi:hypothetical protein